MISVWVEKIPGFVWPLIGCGLGMIIVLDIWWTVRKDRATIKGLRLRIRKLRK